MLADFVDIVIANWVIVWNRVTACDCKQELIVDMIPSFLLRGVVEEEEEGASLPAGRSVFVHKGCAPGYKLGSSSKHLF